MFALAENVINAIQKINKTGRHIRRQSAQESLGLCGLHCSGRFSFKQKRDPSGRSAPGASMLAMKLLRIFCYFVSCLLAQSALPTMVLEDL